MDFNTYDFLGNPPLPKSVKVEWCPHCLEHTATNEGYGICTVCGEMKVNEETVEPIGKGRKNE